MNRRYKEYVARAPNPAEAERRLVDYAREHGVKAAVGMSGASMGMVYKFIREINADGARWLRPRTRITPEVQARIIDARKSHPDAGIRQLKKAHGLPYGHRQITRVLSEVGLMLKPPQPKPTRDPDFWIRICEGRVYIAEAELQVALIARSVGYPGRASEVERMRRRLAKAERKVEWWKSEKVRRDLSGEISGKKLNTYPPSSLDMT